MNKFIRSCAIAMVATAATMAPWNALRAQSAPEPSVVISMAPMSRQLADMSYLAEASGFAQMAPMIKLQAESFLRGVDFTKPSGALLFISEASPEPQVMAFVPVKNIDDLLNTLSQFVEIEDGDEGRYTILPDGAPPMHVKAVEGYAIISPDESMLDTAPANPGEYLQGQPDQYNLAARIYVQRIPEGMRQGLVSMIEQGYMEQMESMGGGIDSELQRQNVEMQLKQIKSYINDTTDLTLGFGVDKANKNLNAEITMVGKDGSELARQSKLYRDSKGTRFAGFLMEGAAFTANVNGTISREDADQAKAQIEPMKAQLLETISNDAGPEQAEFAKEVVDGIMQVIFDTLDEGVLDGGATLMMTEDSADLVVGMQIAKPQSMEDTIKGIVKKLQAEAGDAIQAELNFDTYKGISLHRLVIPFPPDVEDAVIQMFGEEATVIIGFGNQAAYFAFGGDGPLELMKKVVDNSGDAPVSGQPPFQYNLYLAPIMKSVGAMQGEDMMIQMGDKLAGNGRDRVQLKMITVDNGMTFRMELQDGILELIGVAAQMFGGMGGADF